MSAPTLTLGPRLVYIAALTATADALAAHPLVLMEFEDYSALTGDDVASWDRPRNQIGALELGEIERTTGRVFEFVEVLVGLGRRDFHDREPVGTLVHDCEHPVSERLVVVVRRVRLGRMRLVPISELSRWLDENAERTIDNRRAA